jgi:NodT family efflux transporter outer membrane factor (OMF) lipoprotein
MSRSLAFLVAASFVALSSCAVAPRYQRPTIDLPAAFRENDGWQPVRAPEHLDAGEWWTLFGDPQLSALEQQVDVANQNVLATAAEYRRVLAQVDQARAAYFPLVGVGASVDRSKQSVNERDARGATVSSTSRPVTTKSASLDVSWEADLWGRLRSQTAANLASARASGADLAAARLSEQVGLAQTYFQLREIDAEHELLARTLAAYRDALQLTTNRYDSGIATRADVAQAQSLLDTTQVQELDLGLQRSLLEHAIAVLIGQSASAFQLASAPIASAPPPIPEAGVPAELLERRPDVAAAEQRVEAANAQIGVARGAFFPSLSLSGSVGYAATGAAKWLAAPSLFWSVGPALAATLFDGGARRSQSAQAWASYDEDVARYRETVLSGIREVEDNLARLRLLEQEAQAQDAASNAAQQALTVVTNQYKAGTASYLNVVTAQTTALANDRNALAILGERMSASVQLIAALGGSPRET